MEFLLNEFVTPKGLDEITNNLGVCKLIHFDDDNFTLDFFEDTENSFQKTYEVPTDQGFDVQDYMSLTLDKFHIPKRTRIYYKN